MYEQRIVGIGLLRSSQAVGSSGGALQFIRGIGIAQFATRAAELAQSYGERFVIKESALEKLRQSKSLEA
jgi:hypothetical protein